MLFSIFITIASLAVAFAAPCTGGVAPTHGSAVRELFTFSNGTLLENIAVRSNGALLLTGLNRNKLVTLDPRARKPAARVLVEFDAKTANGISGITEYAPDKFAFIAGQFNLTDFTTTGLALWTVDLGRRGDVRPRRVAALPKVGFGNGVAVAPGSRGLVVLADSKNSAIWSVDVTSGAVREIANSAFTVASAQGFPLGINGIRTRGSDLFFVNTNARTVSKVAIRPDGTLGGKVTIVATTPADQTTFDDFALDKQGRAWMATVPNGIDVVLGNGKTVPILGFNSGNTTGPTSAAFGRGSKSEENTLYVTTSFAKLFAIDTTKVKLT
ncbi:hypothetical protein BKA62DRAFT_656627 [Auriculariales sp. MPI-PUGE-AT-0066]|nr:hypothetical protein BKA62DRAFT_656627 [Auriculariales sp. MPI-PUGE-AT-0066]